jgi:general secretion pathway protein G
MNPLTRTLRRSRRAFTLIELLVVMLILALLAALVVPKFFDQQEGAKVTKAQSDLAEVGKMLELFKLDQGRYPSTEEGLNILYENSGNITGWKPYSQKPIPNDPWGHPYIYQYPGSNGDNSYTLESYGADGQPGGEGRNEDIYESL